MKKLAITVLAALVTTAAPFTPAAHATTQKKGGCSNGSGSSNAIAGQEIHEGVMVLALVATGPAGSPTTATVDIPDPTAPISGACEIRINGVSQGLIAQASGTGVAFAVERYTYTASDTDFVEICTHASVRGESSVECVPAMNEPIPPQAVVDALFAIGNLIAPLLWDAANPVICPVLISLGPGLDSTVVRIGPDGDVYLFGALLHDCPPYVL